MTRVAIVTGVCVADDAISAAVESQARTLLELDRVSAVDVFAQSLSRPLPCPSHLARDSWELLRDDRFRTADVAIFHWGIRYGLFDALTVMRPRVPDGPGPLPVAYFHNCTPRHLVDPSLRPVIDESIVQAQLLADTAIPVWTCSQFNIETLVEWGVPRDRTSFVPFAIDPGRPVTDRAPADGRVELLCVGRMVPAKGQHVVVEALGRLPADVRSRCRLRIAGNEMFSSAEYVESLRSLIASMGLQSTVEMVGQPDDDALWRLYEESHVLLAPSLHEGLCVPVLEAYAAGCRVIGSNAGNLPFVVLPPDPIVPVLDVVAWSDAIAQMIEDVLTAADRRAARADVAELLRSYSRPSTRAAIDAALDEVLRADVRSGS